MSLTAHQEFRSSHLHLLFPDRWRRARGARSRGKRLHAGVTRDRAANFSVESCELAPPQLFVYIINLHARQSRYAKLAELVRRLRLPCGRQRDSIHVERIDASNGTERGHWYEGWRLSLRGSFWWCWPDYTLWRQVTPYWTRNVTRGEAGLYLSHMRALRRVRDNARTADGLHLVLEDDAEFDWSSLVRHLYGLHHQLRRYSRSWDVLNLSPIFMGEAPLATLSPGIVGSHAYMYHTHALLVSPRAAEKILRVDRDHQNIITPDEFLSALAWAHPRPSINQLYLPSSDRLAYVGTTVSLVKQATDGVHDTEVKR